MQQGKGLKFFLAITAVFLVGVIGYFTLFLIPQTFYSTDPEVQQSANSGVIKETIRCGGFAGRACPEGMRCNALPSPDAPGTCVEIPEEQEEFNEDDTTLLTYRNEELEFETIYPSDFYVDSSQAPIVSRVTFLPNDEERRKKGHRLGLDFWQPSTEDTLNCKEDQDDLGFVDVDGTFAAKCGFQDYGDVARNHWSVTVINEKYKINFIIVKDGE